MYPFNCQLSGYALSFNKLCVSAIIYSVTEAKIFMLTSKSKNIIKILIFLCKKKTTLKTLNSIFSNYWISMNITIFSIYIKIYFSL